MYCNHSCSCNSPNCPKARVHQKPVSLDDIAADVMAGKYGDGLIRRQLLGDLYDAVQDRVMDIYYRKERR